MWSYATLEYDPSCDRLRNSAPAGPWLIARCSELGRYYRYWFNLHNRASWQIAAPAWDSHISLVRGEELPAPDMWRRHHGDTISFNFSPDILTDDHHVWIPVECQPGEFIRQHLGLSARPTPNFHVTIGHRVPEK